MCCGIKDIIFVPLYVFCLTGQRSAVRGTRKMGQKMKRHGTCRTYPEGQKAHTRRAISGEMRYIKDYLNEH